MRTRLWQSVSIAVMSAASQAQVKATTPVEHLIVIIGENMSFDTMFAAYKAPPGQVVANLLSKEIINEDGTPGPNYVQAVQRVPRTDGTYEVVYSEGKPYDKIPRPHMKVARGARAQVDESYPEDLAPGPFQITRYHSYSTFTGSNPVHRFFQHWQQVNGGQNDLFVWVGLTSGEGSSEDRDPAKGTDFSSEPMGFFNMSTGDLPYFESLARTFAMSDNYHQPIMGGTMPNYIALATAGEVIRYVVNGAPTRPFENQIENPEPVSGTPNWYTRSGYTSGSYTACDNDKEPGVGAIRRYLKSMPYSSFNNGNCDRDTYYLVNNYNSPYSPDGSRKKKTGPRDFVAPPQTFPTLAESLSAKGISWRWYNGGRDAKGGIKKGEYSAALDPLTFFKQVMESDLKKNLVSDDELFSDIDGQMPAVAFVTPPLEETGHPELSTSAAFEAYVKHVVESLQRNKALWSTTAVLITTDEGGGYYDSGYVQAIDFFGDGPRIPLIVVSPWAKKGFVDHTYADHVSISKFVERNWALKPLSARTRDNLPNPTPSTDRYIPGNRPAIGDLFELFDFARPTQK